MCAQGHRQRASILVPACQCVDVIRGVHLQTRYMIGGGGHVVQLSTAL